MKVVVVLLAVVAANAGCSVVMMERVDHPYGPTHLEEPRCTAVKGWVLLDSAVAVGALVSAALTTRVALDEDPVDYGAQLRVAAEPVNDFATPESISLVVRPRVGRRGPRGRAVEDGPPSAVARCGPRAGHPAGRRALAQGDRRAAPRCGPRWRQAGLPA